MADQATLTGEPAGEHDSPFASEEPASSEPEETGPLARFTEAADCRTLDTYE